MEPLPRHLQTCSCYSCLSFLCLCEPRIVEDSQLLCWTSLVGFFFAIFSFPSAVHSVVRRVFVYARRVRVSWGEGQVVRHGAHTHHTRTNATRPHVAAALCLSAFPSSSHVFCLSSPVRLERAATFSHCLLGVSCDGACVRFTPLQGHPCFHPASWLSSASTLTSPGLARHLPCESCFRVFLLFFCGAHPCT